MREHMREHYKDNIQMVTRRGLEPRTHCLKGSCSTG